ncbi:MAG: PDC sensor domain-containing protein, partial [Gammaproteobacteria bacterium]
MNAPLQESIDRQRDILKGWLSASLVRVADDCKRLWPDRQALEARLMEGLTELPYCKYLYLLDERAHQVTSNASRAGLLDAHYGRDRSERPYLAKSLAGAPFSLSDAYISRNARRPTLTAVHA